MANATEQNQFDPAVRLIEPGDSVVGGAGAPINQPLQALANRTIWLKNQTAALQTATAGKAASTTAVNAGNGLSGGGNLTASRTIALGTPGQITAQSQNAVQSSSHTHAIDTATTSRAGIVQLESGTGSQAEDRAATPKAVKAAYDKAIEAINAASGINIPSVGTASTSRAGIVMLNNSTDSQSEDQAATPKAVKAAYDKAVEAANAVRAFSIPTATTSRAGIVQLADRVSANTADANKAITTAAVNRAIDELSENVLGRIGQANTRIDNAVALTGDQTITGAKIFQGDIKASASTAHAAADRYIRLGADATGAYAVNSKSNKVLYLRHDGNLTYDGHNVLLARDISSAVNLDDSNKVASAAAVKTAYDAASAASAAVQNMALTGTAAENGWLKLPNGILMQWGKSTIEGVHRQKEIFFPVAFREIYSIASSAYLPNATYWGNMSGGVVIRSYTKNKFAAQVSSSYEDRAGSDTCILWFAVGKAA
ncbi:tail fiber protein [Neisseria cinerea]|uniref:tail fiber protein n=2 Tax=Neisseria TaxID=482 RepID=UPI002B1CF4B2|nr:tail fiber protein [Neisseria cinerea]